MIAFEKLVVPNFYSDYRRVRNVSDHFSYAGETNPADGVFYPGVETTLPAWLVEETENNLEILLDCPIKMRTIFCRLSLEGVEVPHQVHTDSIMGENALMVYLNRRAHCQGGTSFVKHKAMNFAAEPRCPDEYQAWQNDMNDSEAWEIIDCVEMKPNRAVIFDAKRMHRAEPIGGFGNDRKCGRLVLTGFFDYA